MTDRLRVLRIAAVPLLVMSLPVLSLTQAGAQSIANSFADFSANKDQPVDIEADRLEVFDAKKKAYFRGNVRVTQGKLVMRSKELEVTYTAKNSKKKVAPGSPNAAVKFIRANGRVVIDTPDNQSVTSQWALFDVPGQFITIGGDVVMSQGSNVMKGDKLLIDLKAGTSRLETGSANGKVSDKKGRVRVILNPKDSGAFKMLGKPGEKQQVKGTTNSGAAATPKTLPWRRDKEAADKLEAFGDGLSQ